jgi:hypothetical protein
MKLAILILNSMFLLLFISTMVGEWGNAPAIIAGIAIVNLVLNSIYILIRIPNDFAQE